jgi:hypothetical protein
MNSPKRILLAVALAYAASLPAHADCVLPPAPSKIPDGNTASQQEMFTAMNTLKEYNGDVEQNRLSRTDEERMHNTAVDTLQKVAAKFNEQVRTFKAKSG